jgi:hypothetical protein
LRGDGRANLSVARYYHAALRVEKEEKRSHTMAPRRTRALQQDPSAKRDYNLSSGISASNG